MPDPQPEQRSRAVDSPWFWLYLFCTMGLALLIAFQPRLESRQRDLDERAQGRTRSLDPDSSDSEPLNIPPPRVRLGWLIAVLGLTLALAWARFWYVQVWRVDGADGKPTRRFASGTERSRPED